MAKKSTGELLEDFKDPVASLAVLLEAGGFEETGLPVYLESLLEQKDLRKSDVIRESGLNETFAYQIFSGARRPSRDKLLQVLFALHCSVPQADRALYRAGLSSLYCHDRRDVIIIFCLTHGYTLEQTDQELVRFGEQAVNSRHENAADR